MNKVISIVLVVGFLFFVREIVIATGYALDELEAGAWTFISACLILTGLVVAFVEWQARLHHRNVCRDIEVRVKAVEDRS